ncbi:tRNA-guanine transglycosylase [Picosynechococcus sp. PCC 73109]
MEPQFQGLETRRGKITFPTYFPVTTFSDRHYLDKLVRPYLPRLASGVMMSYYYAKQLSPEDLPRLPLCVDSGGFVSLFNWAKVKSQKRLGVIEIQRDGEKEILHPSNILELQEVIADIAFTLDFPIPPDMAMREAKKRQKLTIANGLWAIANRRRRDLPLYGCIQGWDIDSFRACALAYVDQPFDGFAIGGLVPRSRDRELIERIVVAVKEVIGDRPLHVFGLGHPAMVKRLYRLGVHSVDSSSYAQYALDGKLWSDPPLRIEDPSGTDSLQIALYNLAIATGQTLPLAMTERMFRFVREKATVCS